VIRFENVTKVYQGTTRPAVENVSLEIVKGEFVFLVGASGSGKSTFLRLVLREERATRGVVHVAGKDVGRLANWKVPQLRRQIGVVFQDFRLLDHLSAFDNVALPLRVAGAPEQRIRDNVTELLHWVGLADKLNARPPTLSGGQQQRIAIARAVIARPQLLLADEPTGNVDEAMALRLLRLFEEMNRLGTTIVLATHSEALAARSGHPRLHLVDGEIAVAAAKEPA
jgi:cell division transport system ATP-binding protein